MKSHLLAFVCLLIIFLPTIVLGKELVGDGGGAGGGALGDIPAFIPLVGIPGINGNEPGLEMYINAIYRLAISLAALLAVVKIVIAGAKYMLDDIVTHKEEAKQDIWGALMGLLVIIAAVVILNTINSDLTKTNLLLDSVTIDNSIADGEGMANADLTKAKSPEEAIAIIRSAGGDPRIAKTPLTCGDLCNNFNLAAGGSCSGEQIADFIKNTLQGFAIVNIAI